VENQAVLITRLRVKPEFLPAVRERIQTVLVELASATKTEEPDVMIQVPDDAEVN